MFRANANSESWIVWDCNRNDIPSSSSTLIYKKNKCWRHWATKLLNDLLSQSMLHKAYPKASYHARQPTNSFIISGNKTSHEFWYQCCTKLPKTCYNAGQPTNSYIIFLSCWAAHKFSYNIGQQNFSLWQALLNKSTKQRGEWNLKGSRSLEEPSLAMGKMHLKIAMSKFSWD
jgi:hypothetical protein